jgi:hypothetical protein
MTSSTRDNMASKSEPLELILGDPLEEILIFNPKAFEEMDFGLRYYKYVVHNALKGVTHDVTYFSLLWQVIEHMENNCHLPYFTPKVNFLPQVQVSKDLEGYINSSKKHIISLFEINEVTIENFIEVPTKDITFIQTLIPKMENFEKIMR